MQEFLNVVGNIANAVAAICAVYAIVETHNHYERDKQDEKAAHVSEKKDTLYKECVIDCFVNKIIRDISEINREMLQIALNDDIDALQEIYIKLRVDSQVWLYEIEIIKFFNIGLYNEVRKKIENLIDTYSKIIDKGVSSGRISKYFTSEINKELTIIKTILYKEYLKML